MDRRTYSSRLSFLKNTTETVVAHPGQVSSSNKFQFLEIMWPKGNVQMDTNTTKTKKKALRKFVVTSLGDNTPVF